MTKVNLALINEDGSKQVVEHVVEAMDGFQFGNMMKAVNNIIKELREDEGLKGLFGEMFGNADVRDVDLAEFNSDFIMNGINSFEVLFAKLPDRAFELLAILSNLNLDVLKSQKFDCMLDIYDAVIEENDIERLVNRIKKSLALTTAKAKFLNFTKKVTGTPETNLKAVMTQR